MIKSQEFEQFIDRLKLRHFKGKEFTPYWSRKRNGVQNGVPPESLWTNIVPTLVILDQFRERIGMSVSLLSTYRRPAYNAAIGGEPNSFHMKFQAIDFTSDFQGPKTWAAILKQMRGKKFKLPVNGGEFIFKGGIGLYPSFVHVDTRGYDANW